MNKREAQERVRRIFAFRAELSALQREGVIQLPNADIDGITLHHSGLLEDYSRRYDTDLNISEHQLSWGMRIASTLGAIAFSLGVFLFFQFYWDTFSTLVQVGLVSLAPFLGWGLSEAVARRFKSPHYTSLAVLVAIACFVANLYVVGRIYNIAPSPNAFLAWGLFGLLLAYRHDLALILGVSLIGLVEFLGGFLSTLSGFAWPEAQIPEFYLAASLLCLAVPFVIRPTAIQRYRQVYIFVGLMLVYCALGWLLSWPGGSLLPAGEPVVEWTYTVAAFTAAGFGIRQCIRAQWVAGTYLSAGFFVVFLLQRYCDWFWDEWPNYVFFLTLGVFTIAIITLLRRMRTALRGAEQ